MSEFVNDKGLSPEQQAVLIDNVRVAIETGLGGVYSSCLEADASRHKYLADSARIFGTTGINSEAEEMAAKYKSAMSLAELPFVFGYEPSNMARSVVMARADHQTGQKLRGSEIQIGLIDGLAGNGKANIMDGFHAEQLAAAVEQIRKQEEVGLT